MSALASRVGHLVDARGDLRPVALLRAVLGVVVLLHFRPTLTAAKLPVERFHEPWWDWVPVPSAGVYRLLIWVGVAAGAAMVVGLASRVATVVAGLVVFGQMVVDVASFSHNRAFLCWLLFGLSLLPTGSAFALDQRLPWARRGTDGYLWPVYLLRGIASLVYLTSGLTKWFDADWRSGLVLWARVTRGAEHIPFGGWLFDLVTDRTFYRVAAPVVLATEVALGVGLWFRRTRPWMLGLAVAFHVSIEITASVQTFSYSAIAALLVWLTPWPYTRPSWLHTSYEASDASRVPSV